MTDTPLPPESRPQSMPWEWLSRGSTTLTLKLMALGAALLVLLLPLMLVWDIIDDRARLAQSVSQEIGSSWGAPQQVLGPVLVLTGAKPDPVTEFVPAGNGARHRVTRQPPTPRQFILPESLDVQIDLQPEKRHRGIYSAVVYTSRLSITGEMQLPTTARLDAPVQAQLYLGVGDSRSLTEAAQIQFGEQQLGLEPGALHGVGSALSHALVADIALSDLPEDSRSIPFRLELDIKGSDSVSVIPIARQSQVRIAGPWADPSFTGHTLPSERKVTESEFSASWKLAHYGRNFGQHWLAADKDGPGNRDIDRLAVSVRLLDQDSGYRLVERAIKYGALIIALTFTLFVLLELITGTKIRLYHYGLSGTALILFYLMLLSLSEVIGAGPAYLLATLATSIQVGMFARSFAGSQNRAVLTGGALAALYAYIYLILRMDSYAMLSGTLLLFIALSGIMYATRFVDSYGKRPPQQAAQAG